MHYVSTEHDHSGKELIDVLRKTEIDFDERNSFIASLLDVDAGILAPDQLGVPEEDETGIYVYRSSSGASWPGGFGIWAAFTYDEDGVLVLLVAKEFSGSSVEHSGHLSAAKRRKQNGTRETGEDLDI